MVPFCHPLSQFLAQEQEIQLAIQRVLQSGQYILGREVEALEAEFAAYIGVDHAIGVANGTDAVALSLMALGIGWGDEVITVSHTAVATIAGIRMVGASPVFVDIDDFFTLDSTQLEKALSSRTKAVLAVHLYGQPANLDPILAFTERHGIHLVEDCAQAHGARYHGKRVGSFGAMAAFSFYPTKNLGAMGDGGMIATSDLDLSLRVRRLRQYGWSENRGEGGSAVEGINSRLDELQAAILRIRLKSLDESNRARNQIATFYSQSLLGLNFSLPATRMGADHVFHLYVVRMKNRDGMRNALADLGIATGVHYPVPVHMQAAYRKYSLNSLVHTERAASEVLSLPIYPQLSMEQAEGVVTAIRSNPGVSA